VLRPGRRRLRLLSGRRARRGGLRRVGAAGADADRRAVRRSWNGSRVRGGEPLRAAERVQLPLQGRQLGRLPGGFRRASLRPAARAPRPRAACARAAGAGGGGRREPDGRGGGHAAVRGVGVAGRRALGRPHKRRGGRRGGGRRLAGLL
jgi:hypothetical protein